jgi:hypothetical protein
VLFRSSAIDGTGWTEDVDILYSAAYATRRNDETLMGLQSKLLYLMALLQGADAKPTSQAMKAVKDQQAPLKEMLGRWSDLKSKDLKSLNEALRKANLPALDFSQMGEIEIESPENENED